MKGMGHMRSYQGPWNAAGWKHRTAGKLRERSTRVVGDAANNEHVDTYSDQEWRDHDVCCARCGVWVCACVLVCAEHNHQVAPQDMEADAGCWACYVVREEQLRAEQVSKERAEQVAAREQSNQSSFALNLSADERRRNSDELQRAADAVRAHYTDETIYTLCREFAARTGATMHTLPQPQRIELRLTVGQEQFAGAASLAMLRAGGWPALQGWFNALEHQQRELKAKHEERCEQERATHPMRNPMQLATGARFGAVADHVASHANDWMHANNWLRAARDGRGHG